MIPGGVHREPAPERGDFPELLHSLGLRLLITGGKGGVGKTTCAAAAGLALARLEPERRILLLSTDPAHSLAHALRGEVLPGNLTLLELDATAALERFMGQHREVLMEVARRGTFLDEEDISNLFDLSLPGMDELMAFLELTRWLEEDRFDCVVVDTAPTGHTLRLLGMPALLRRWLEMMDTLVAKVRYMKRVFAGSYSPDPVDAFIIGLAGAVENMGALLTDPSRSRFLLITLAEPVVLAETADLLEELARQSIAVAAVVVNQLDGEPSCAVCETAVREHAAALRDAWPVLAAHPVWALPPLPEEPRGAWLDRSVWGAAFRLDASPELPSGALAALAGAAVPEVVSPLPPPRHGLKLALFAGKGGVGKSTFASAAALHLARSGAGRVMLFSTDPAHSLAACLGQEVGALPVEVEPGLTALEIDPGAEFQALKESYAAELRQIFSALLPSMDLTFDRDVMERMLDISPPGLDEVMALTRAMAVVREGAHDLIIFDTAPTGHLLRLLELPGQVDAWLKTFFGLFLKYRSTLRLPKTHGLLVEMSKNLKVLRGILADPTQAALYAVSIPTELARAETEALVRACRRMEVPVTGLWLNRTTRSGSCPWCGDRARREADVIRRLAEALGPDLPLGEVQRGPLPRSRDDLASLGRRLFHNQGPAA